MRDLDNFMGHFTILGPARRFGLILVVGVGLLVVLPEIHAGQQQADTPFGAESADQAYREVADKNYPGAIQDFRKALAADPSNAIWRKDLGFAFLAAGFPEKAVTEFERVYSAHPEDLGVALQLGYLSQQLHRDEDAGKYFGEAARSVDPEISTPAQKALADLQASQLSDRKQKAYDLLDQHRTGEAIKAFEAIHSDDPSDLSVTLQLGYLALELHREEDARKYFELATQSPNPEISAPARKELADLQTTQLNDRKQKGYDLVEQHHSDEAIKAFESIHTDDPSDASVTLQLGYLYQANGRMGDAREMFTEADKDADPKIVAEANAGLNEVRLQTKLWFASFYAEPFYESRFSDEVNPATAKVGLNLNPYFQPYIGLRFDRDIRSVAGELPQIFADNSTVISIGVQSTLAKTGIVLYAEAGIAVNMIGERPLAASDYRVGAAWFRPWGTELFAAGNGDRSISLTGSAYADAGFYSRYDHNFIANVQVREGINLPTGPALPMQLLAATNLIKDSNGNFYNNVVEVGPVLRIAPLRHLPSLTIEAQYMRGFYDVHDPTDPYGPRYGDFRIFLIWSKSF
jgi:tetratricopeptide (TPR) repeat protein